MSDAATKLDGTINGGFFFDRSGIQTNPHPSQEFYFARAQALQEILDGLPDKSKMRSCGYELHEITLAKTFKSPDNIKLAECTEDGHNRIRGCLCSQGQNLAAGLTNDNHLCAHRMIHEFRPAPLLEHLTPLYDHQILARDVWEEWYEDIRDHIRTKDKAVANARFSPERLVEAVHSAREKQEQLKREMLHAVHMFKVMLLKAIAHGQSYKP